MDPEYGRRYADLYNRHWWWRARESAILGELDRLSRPPGTQRLLDVGCGDGLFFDKLSLHGVVEGIEPDVRLLDPNGKWRSAIHAVAFDRDFRPAHRYDVILMLDVLEHLPEPESALRHGLSLLAPGGRMIITVPAFQWLWTRHDEINQHVQRFSRGTFHALAQAAGMTIVRERFLFQWLVPAKLLVRMLERVLPTRAGLARVPPGPVNTALALASRAELRLASVLPFPFGSSLMVTGVPAPARAAAIAAP